MGIPAIAPYSMPTENELPQNRIDWRPRVDRVALLIHDMQNYFLEPFTPDTSPVTDLIENIRVIRDRCDALGIPVIYTAQPGAQTQEQRGLQWDMWGEGIPGGAKAEAISDALTPRSQDTVLTKWRYNAFLRTDLAAELVARGRDQLIVTGIYAHIGCLMTASHAFMTEIQAFLVADAVADFSADYHRMALDYASQRCAATISAAGLLAEFAPVDQRGELVS